jgi:hypothetical protein
VIHRNGSDRGGAPGAASLPPLLPALLALVALLALGASSALRAQPAAGTAAPSSLAVVRARLLLLPAAGCDVRYSPGSLDRAATVQEWLCELAAGAARSVRRATPLEVLLLAREEWGEAALPCVFGVPCVVGPGVLALPSAGDAGTVALWTDTLGALPVLSGTPFVGSVEEVASLAPADALAAALAARELAAAAGFVVEEPWLIELLGHALYLDATRRGGTGRGEAAAAFWSAAGALPPAAAGAASPGPPPSIAGSLPSIAGPLPSIAGPLRVELRRQAALFAAAAELAGRARHLPGRQLWRLQEKGGGVLRAADLREQWPAAFAGLDGQPVAAAAPH